MLKRHPSVARCSQKEPQYFSQTPDWKTNLADYQSLFSNQDGVKLFEASTTYTMFPLQNLNIWDALYEFNPKLKLVYIVRPPLERVVSAYVHLYQRGWTDLSFQKAIFGCPSILYTSRYYMQIAPYLKRFGREQVKILFLSDLKSDLEGTKKQLSEFLDIDHRLFPDEIERLNSADSSSRLHRKWDKPGLPMKVLRKFSPSLFRLIAGNSERRFDSKPHFPLSHQRIVLDLLREDIDQFERLTNRCLDHWRHLPDEN